MKIWGLLWFTLASGCGGPWSECVDCNCPTPADYLQNGSYRINVEGTRSENLASAASQYPMFGTTVTDLVVSVDSQANTLTFAYTVSGEAQSTVWTYKD